MDPILGPGGPVFLSAGTPLTKCPRMTNYIYLPFETDDNVSISNFGTTLKFEHFAIVLLTELALAYFSPRMTNHNIWPSETDQVVQ
jgi:hypothetical protein